MAFEDDMIEAGFSDEMNYLDYLMDEGDRLSQQLIERESRMTDYQSPYDGLSKRQIEQLERDCQEQEEFNFTERLDNFTQWQTQSQEYIEWKSGAKTRLFNNVWRLIKIFNYSWETPSYWTENNYRNDNPLNYFLEWHSMFMWEPPKIMDALFNLWIIHFALDQETLDWYIWLSDEETELINCDLYRCRHRKKYNPKSHINIDKTYQLVEDLLFEFLSPEEKIFRSNWKSKKNSFSYSQVNHEIEIDKVENALCKNDTYLAFKNKLVLLYSFIDDLCNANDNIDFEVRLRNTTDYYPNFGDEIKSIIKKADIFELKSIWKQYVMGGSWFKLNEKETIFYSSIYPLFKKTNYWNEVKDLKWVVFCVHPLRAWMNRMDKHPEELFKVLETAITSKSSNNFRFSSVVSSKNLKDHLLKLIKCYKEETSDLYARKFKDPEDSVLHSNFSSVRGIFSQNIMFELAEWNLAHPNQQF